MVKSKKKKEGGQTKTSKKERQIKKGASRVAILNWGLRRAHYEIWLCWQKAFRQDEASAIQSDLNSPRQPSH